MIIITGATGLVGRYLIEHLARAGENVVAAGRNARFDTFYKNLGISRVPVDVTDPATFKLLPAKPVKAFVHLAAVIPAAVKDIRSDIFLKVNTLGTFYALEYCRQNDIKKFLFTTTRFECEGHTELPITEAMGRKYTLTGDHASYVISKVAGSEYVELYTQDYGCQGIVLRLTGLLGYGRQEGYYTNGKFHPSAFEVFYKNAKSLKQIEIWGPHSAQRDSLYVKDAVRAVYSAISSNSARGLYNIASGEGLTTEDEAKIFAQVFGSSERPLGLVYRPEIQVKDTSYIFDISKAKRDLGWSPTFTYADILRDYDREVQSGRFQP